MTDTYSLSGSSISSELEWIQPEGAVVPMEKFGKDHWSTFGYIETRITDYRGMLEHDHMRCNEIRHPLWAGAGTRAAFVGGMASGTEYPTRLKGEETEPGHFSMENLCDHDDYD